MAKSGRFPLVGVGVDQNRKPDAIHVIFGQGIEGGVPLQVVERDPLVLPGQGDLKLEVDGALSFVDAYYLEKCYGDTNVCSFDVLVQAPIFGVRWHHFVVTLGQGKQLTTLFIGAIFTVRPLVTPVLSHLMVIDNGNVDNDDGEGDH